MAPELINEMATRNIRGSIDALRWQLNIIEEYPRQRKNAVAAARRHLGQLVHYLVTHRYGDLYQNHGVDENLPVYQIDSASGMNVETAISNWLPGKHDVSVEEVITDALRKPVNHATKIRVAKYLKLAGYRRYMARSGSQRQWRYRRSEQTIPEKRRPTLPYNEPAEVG